MRVFRNCRPLDLGEFRGKTEIWPEISPPQWVLGALPVPHDDWPRPEFQLQNSRICVLRRIFIKSPKRHIMCRARHKTSLTHPTIDIVGLYVGGISSSSSAFRRRLKTFVFRH